MTELGQFELKTNISKEYEPDTLELIVVCSFYNHTDKDELKKDVIKETEKLKSKIDNCSVTYSDLKFTERAFNVDQKFMGMKPKSNKKEYSCSVIINIKVNDFTKDKLTNIVDIIESFGFVSTVEYKLDISYRDEAKKALKREVAEKCKSEASEIVDSLGYKIAGVHKIVYNSSGSLLEDSKFRTVNNDYCSDYEFADCEYEATSDGFGNNTFESSRDSFINSLVDNIMETKIELSDNITVVFLVG